MLRHKLNLKKIKEPLNNACKPLHIEINNYLNKKYKKVYKIDGSYKKSYKNDIFFKYFLADRKFAYKMGMEEKNKQIHLFAAFIVG